MNEFVKSDCYRYYGNYKLTTVLNGFFTNRLFRFQVALRLAGSKKTLEKVIGKVLWKLNRTKEFIQISPETKIGYGLKIGHFAPIIINPSTVIGDNFSVAQFVSIGSNHNTPATIGNNVYIGPNCCVIEDVSIGNNVTVGGEVSSRRTSRKMLRQREIMLRF